MFLAGRTARTLPYQQELLRLFWQYIAFVHTFSLGGKCCMVCGLCLHEPLTKATVKSAVRLLRI